MSSKAFDLRRLYRTVPELDKATSRSGITFVNILFGLVVTQAAIALASELVKAYDTNWDAVDKTRLAHLAVAITLTVLSWIGYHQSQNYAPFLIKFFNIPLWQFLLDVLMVVVYYVVLAFAEGHLIDSLVRKPDARPEAALVAFVFLLYVLWDLLGYLLFRDSEYTNRFETPREADATFGPRRIVSVTFFVIASALAVAIWCWRPTSPAGVIDADFAIIATLVLYRLAKPAFDKNVKLRGE